MPDPGTVASVAGIVSGFGIAVFLFRLERELKIAEANLIREESEREPNWIPIADWLVFSAVIIALLFSIRPLLGPDGTASATVRKATAAGVASVVLLAGYLPAILGHYNFLYGLRKQRPNPTFAEAVIVLATIVGACVAYVGVLRGSA
jgi:hypothetical protein